MQVIACKVKENNDKLTQIPWERGRKEVQKNRKNKDPNLRQPKKRSYPRAKGRPRDKSE